MSTGFMDTSRNFEETLVRPSTIFVNSLKGSADGFSAQSGGLLRYHSAPSSTFSALLEPDFYSTNEATEIAQLLGHNELNDFTSFSPGKFALKPHHNQQCSIQEGQPRHVYSCQNDVLLRQCVPAGTAVFEDHIGQGPLSAILEHTGEETCLPHPCQGEPIATTSSEATSDSDNQYKSDLIRHSSLPTDFLSRLAMIDMSEKPMGSQLGSNMQSSSQQATSHIQSTSPVIPDNTGGKIYMISSRMSPRGVLVRKCLTDEGMPGKQEEYSALHSELNQQCALLRQSSSPAGLLSQLSLDELASPTDKMVTPLTQGLVLHESDTTLIDFGMQKIAALGQRKRGREVDAGLLKSSPEDDEMINQIATSPRNHDLGGAANGDFGDSVLCKSRAKRGCATHPRSIAERVRRTKISERIKKLQDLVPNLDKQAHTADMLDEVVEYVKLLQRQVEELSKQSYECDGTCQKK